ncbi:hypothetical protein [Marinobacter sp.]|uniref:hypothetical protein n=1 Tax=Marinobacter sp. TaxID=50741 RepID=UPI0035C67719
MKIDQQTVLWGLAGVAGAYLLGKHIIKDAAGEVGQAVNPTNHDNVFNRGANKLAQAVTGKASWGIWLADIINPIDAEAMKQPITIVDKQPPEASVLPNSWARNTPGPSGRASVTKQQFNDLRTL